MQFLLDDHGSRAEWVAGPLRRVTPARGKPFTAKGCVGKHWPLGNAAGCAGTPVCRVKCWRNLHFPIIRSNEFVDGTLANLSDTCRAFQRFIVGISYGIGETTCS